MAVGSHPTADRVDDLTVDGLVGEQPFDQLVELVAVGLENRRCPVLGLRDDPRDLTVDGALGLIGERPLLHVGPLVEEHRSTGRVANRTDRI
jgi:hypothetical protein